MSGPRSFCRTFLLGLGRRIDRRGQHDPAAVWQRANLSGRRSGCRGGYSDPPGKSDRSHRQGLRTDRAAVSGHACPKRRYSDALRRIITYVDVPLEQWRDQELRSRNLPDHVIEHLLTMARLHVDNRYDRLTHDVEAITGRPATGIRDFVAQHAELFGPKSQSTKASERV